MQQLPELLRWFKKPEKPACDPRLQSIWNELHLHQAFQNPSFLVKEANKRITLQTDESAAYHFASYLISVANKKCDYDVQNTEGYTESTTERILSGLRFGHEIQLSTYAYSLPDTNGWCQLLKMTHIILPKRRNMPPERFTKTWLLHSPNEITWYPDTMPLENITILKPNHVEHTIFMPNTR